VGSIPAPSTNKVPPIAQLVEQSPLKRTVAGSSPAGRTMKNSSGENTFKVHLMESSCSLPFSLAVHTYFLIEKGTEINRWELSTPFKFGAGEKKYGNIYKNRYPNRSGMSVLPFSFGIRFKSRVVKTFVGDEARELIKTIEFKSGKYPHKDKYSLFGPNSNTYAKWIIDNSDNVNCKLSWRAFGKNYKV
jgi:hypothetical protein